MYARDVSAPAKLSALKGILFVQIENVKHFLNPSYLFDVRLYAWQRQDGFSASKIIAFKTKNKNRSLLIKTRSVFCGGRRRGSAENTCLRVLCTHVADKMRAFCIRILSLGILFVQRKGGTGFSEKLFFSELC